MSEIHRSRTLAEVTRASYMMDENAAPMKDSKEGDVFNLDGILFKKLDKGYLVMNPIIVEGNKGHYDAYCTDCRDVVGHLMNDIATKVKCTKCGKLSDLVI